MMSLPVALVALVATQSIELYHARNRPAAELVPIAQTALGTDGQVTLDARTATLVLNGSPAAVRRAIALLEQIDVPLREVILDVTVRETRDLEALEARVSWRTSLGGVSVGTLPIGAEGIAASISGTRSTETDTAGSRLRVTEGGTGVLRTGTALPVLFSSYWSTTTAFVPVDTGFEASVQIFEDDRVYLELRPFAGRIGTSGELNYVAAATSVTVSPGETVVLAELSRDESARSADVTGVSRERLRHDQIVLVSVELER